MRADFGRATRKVREVEQDSDWNQIRSPELNLFGTVQVYWSEQMVFPRALKQSQESTASQIFHALELV
jgi:hypothetical protein